MSTLIKNHDRLASLGLSSALFLGAALAGCTAPEGTRFADASPAQLDRTYRAASGHDLVSVLLLGSVFSGEHQPTGCPRIVTEGQDTTVTGGCTLENGTRLEGEIALHNLPAWDADFPAHDPSQPASIELDFRIAFPEGGGSMLDGRIDFAEEPEPRISGDLTIDAAGITSTSRLTVACEVEGPCTMAAGSEIEISDLGRASVEGTWHFEDPPTGQLTVRGADVLVFDVGGRESSRCVPYTVGDKRGTVCAPDFEVEDWFEPPAADPGTEPREGIQVEDDRESPPPA